MAKKTSSKIPADEKWSNQDFDLFGALEALDKKDYGWFSKLTEEQQRKFVPYMMVHWMSSITTGGVLGSYYTLSVDKCANTHLFNERVGQHPELQWLMLCASSPGTGKQRHSWIPHLSTQIGRLQQRAKIKDVSEYFTKIYPGVDGQSITAAAEEFTAVQNHRYRLAELNPSMKVSDIEALSSIVSPEEVDEYEKLQGNG